MTFPFEGRRPKVIKLPAACPVCNGMTKVDRPAESIEKAERIQCPACSGKGYILIHYTPEELGL